MESEKLKTMRKIIEDSGLDIGVYQNEEYPEYFGITCNGEPWYWNIKYFKARGVISDLIKGHALRTRTDVFTYDKKSFSEIFRERDDDGYEEEAV